MALLLEYTDELCVRLNRDILFIEFDYYNTPADEEFLKQDTPHIKETLEWLDANNIKYTNMGPLSNSGWLSGYYPRYFIDVPWDINDPLYQLVEQYLENSDGTLKDPRKKFFYSLLEYCKPIFEESKKLWDDPDWCP